MPRLRKPASRAGWFLAGALFSAVVSVPVTVVTEPPLEDLARKVGLRSEPAIPEPKPNCDEGEVSSEEYVTTLQARFDAQSCWRSEIAPVYEGDVVDVLLGFANHSAKQVDDVTIKFELPTGLEYVRRTTYLKNSSNPDGLLVSDRAFEATGINVGSYSPGANFYLYPKVRVVKDGKFKCGTTTLDIKAHVWPRPVDDREWGWVRVHVRKDC